MGFQNHPPADFSKEEHRRKFEDALAAARRSFGKTYSALISGREYAAGEKRPSANPARPSEILGLVAQAGLEQAAGAVGSMEKSAPAWGGLPAPRRAEILENAARLMASRRWELAAWEVFEVGKTWREADADVCEAVDYLNYYADAARRLDSEKKLLSVPGETNEEIHIPRGPAAIIAPWNFPLAILAGMSSAALAAGNPVVLKPAAPSSIIGHHLARIYLEAGVPPEAVHFLPGKGSVLGDFLVRHPRVAVVAFTGSQEVGLDIIEKAAKPAPGQVLVKKVVAELGGKNAVIVDSDADLDEAIKGILASAFAYQGQKCSALSRLIVLESVHKSLVDRLVPAAASLRIGPPEDPRHEMGPLIERAALEKTRRYAELGKREAKTHYVTPEDRLPPEGYFAGPSIFETDDLDSPLVREEIFGPVLTVIRARDFDHALALAVDSEFALTGGLYSRRPEHIERAKREWPVGNLYINRKITGAVVGRQPFGGFQLSGTGTKAGGPEYLAHFLQSKTVTENTLRHGFPLEE